MHSFWKLEQIIFLSWKPQVQSQEVSVAKSVEGSYFLLAHDDFLSESLRYIKPEITMGIISNPSHEGSPSPS